MCELSPSSFPITYPHIHYHTIKSGYTGDFNWLKKSKKLTEDTTYNKGNTRMQQHLVILRLKSLTQKEFYSICKMQFLLNVIFNLLGVLFIFWWNLHYVSLLERSNYRDLIPDDSLSLVKIFITLQRPHEG